MYQEIYNAIQARWDSIAKPIDGFGRFEKMICKIGAVQQSTDVRADKRCTVIFCSDNGVVEENVAQTDSSVTALVAENIHKGIATSARLACVAHSDITAVDMGMAREVNTAVNKAVSRGTKNMLKEPAMTLAQARQAYQSGMDIVCELKQKGYDIIAIGEMGIGNTTTASAIASVLLNLPVEQVTGRGSGLSDEGYAHKIDVIKRAIALHKPRDIWHTLSALGGYDIIAMAGAAAGAKKYGIPIIIDGAVSQVAALAASRIESNAADYVIASHIGREPVSSIILKELNLDAVLCADMALGEGSGAVMLFPLIDMVLSVYRGSTFGDINMMGYERY